MAGRAGHGLTLVLSITRCQADDDRVTLGGYNSDGGAVTPSRPPPSKLAAEVAELLDEAGRGTSYQATLHSSGAIAQGRGAVAAGEGGVAVGGSVAGGVSVNRTRRGWGRRRALTLPATGRQGHA